jgi:hypothetical protein
VRGSVEPRSRPNTAVKRVDSRALH